jgi:molybdopterin synthase sulfur carrier subunit
MTIRIHFFGMIAEALNCSTHDIENYEKHTLGELEQDLLKHFPELARFSYQLALNQEIAGADARLAAVNEIGILPPFAGG